MASSTNAVLTIGVQGASGKMGASTIAELLRLAAPGGHRIVAISRTPEKAAAGVEGRRGDFSDPESLRTAYTGLDRLIIIPGGTMDQAGAKQAAAVEIAAAVGVGHITYISGVGCHREVEPRLGARHWLTEQALMRHAAHWSIIRMSYFIESYYRDVAYALKSGVLVGLGEGVLSLVSREDVAHAAAALQFDAARHDGYIYQGTGPELLNGAQRAAIISELSGKPVEFQVITTEAFQEIQRGLKVPDFFVALMTNIHERYVEGCYDVLSHDIDRLTGRAPRSFRTLLAAQLKNEFPTA